MTSARTWIPQPTPPPYKLRHSDNKGVAQDSGSHRATRHHVQTNRPHEVNGFGRPDSLVHRIFNNSPDSNSQISDAETLIIHRKEPVQSTGTKAALQPFAGNLFPALGKTLLRPDDNNETPCLTYQ